jgi:acyl-CoA hydrolase
MAPPPKSRRMTPESAAALVGPRDEILVGLAVGQPIGILEALGARTDLEDVRVYGGLLLRPFSFLQNPGVRYVSGFYGPIERMLRDAGTVIEFLACDFHGFERLAARMKPRIVLAPTTPPDAGGWLSFGVHAGASYHAFLDAMRDPERLAIAEMNPRMPRIGGIPELGDNRVHVSEVDVMVEHEEDLPVIPIIEPTAEEMEIARHVTALIPDGAVLQFGIGGVPDGVARILARGERGGFAIHTELVSDGVMHLHQAGKISNRKPLYNGLTVGTFALGSAELYPWLDGNPDVRMLPVSATNGPAILVKLPRLVSVNGALAVDLLGQVAADHIGGRQYSGVGGHESFVTGAGEAPDGRSILCLESTARVGGRTVSRIVPRLNAGATVTSPRHHVQWVATEYGAADLSVLSDTGRARALIELAHPDFRDELRAALR